MLENGRRLRGRPRPIPASSQPFHPEAPIVERTAVPGTRSSSGSASSWRLGTSTRSRRRPSRRSSARAPGSRGTRRRRTRPISSSHSTLPRRSAPRRILLVGGSGGRIDHLLGELLLLGARPTPSSSSTRSSAERRLHVIRGERRLEGQPGESDLAAPAARRGARGREPGARLPLRASGWRRARAGACRTLRCNRGARRGRQGCARRGPPGSRVSRETLSRARHSVLEEAVVMTAVAGISGSEASRDTSTRRSAATRRAACSRSRVPPPAARASPALRVRGSASPKR